MAGPNRIARALRPGSNGRPGGPPVTPGAKGLPGGLRGLGVAALRQTAQTEVMTIESLMAELPAEFQGSYRTSLNNILAEKGPGTLDSLSSLREAVQQAVEMIRESESRGEFSEGLPEPEDLTNRSGAGRPRGRPAIGPGVRSVRGLSPAGQPSAVAPAFMRISLKA